MPDRIFRSGIWHVHEGGFVLDWGQNQFGPSLSHEGNTAREKGFARVLGITGLVVALSVWGMTEAGSDDLQQNQEPFPRLERLTIASAVTVEPIRAIELLRGGSPGPIAMTKGRLPVGGTIGTRVSRRLDSLWSMQIDPTLAPTTALQVQYELQGANGRIDVLSLGSAPEVEIPCRVIPIEPYLTQTVQGVAVYEGGATLYLNLDEVKTAGNYHGTLMVTVNRL